MSRNTNVKLLVKKNRSILKKSNKSTNNIELEPEKLIEINSAINSLQSEVNKCENCRFILKTQTTSTQRQHVITNKCDNCQDKFKCKYCYKHFLTKRTLVRHIATHVDKHSHTCKICLLKFTGKNTLQAHVRIHTGEKPFKCNVCEKAFNRPDTLKTHMRNHTNETPYECKVCGKKFKFNSSFHSHKCVTPNQVKARPFKCKTCDKTYINKCSLKLHTRLHDKIDSSKLYKCFICDKTFGYHFTLKKHLMRLHSSEYIFKCNFLQCTKSFKEKYQLIIHHKRDHNNLEPKIAKSKKKIAIPAKCTYCNKDFSRWKSNLKRHERTHTKEQKANYKCHLCFRMFKDIKIFQNHAKVHELNDKQRMINEIQKKKLIVRIKKLSKNEILNHTENKIINALVENNFVPVTDVIIKQEIEDELDAILNEIEERNINNIKIEIDDALNEIFSGKEVSNKKLQVVNDASCHNNYKRKLRCTNKINIEPLRMNNEKQIEKTAFSVVFNWPKSKK